MSQHKMVKMVKIAGSIQVKTQVVKQRGASVTVLA